MTDEPPFLDCVADTLRASCDVLEWNRVANTCICEADARATSLVTELFILFVRKWLNVFYHTRVLTRTASLLLIKIVELAALSNRLAVAHLRRANLHVHAVFTLYSRCIHASYAPR